MDLTHKRSVQEADLDAAIYDTVRYFDIFEMPLTTTQIWRGLIGAQRVFRLHEVEMRLRNSPWLAERLISVWGYYCLHTRVKDMAGATVFVRRRLRRHAIAAQKWKLARRLVKWLAWIPGVRMIGGSGSLALFNTHANSDLDLFIIVQSGRMWTTRLLLLVMAQLLGRRRTYWEDVAPDKLCMNHYVTESSLSMPADVRNLYTAMAYTWMVPLVGLGAFRHWQEVNGGWMRRYVLSADVPQVPPRLYIEKGSWLGRIQSLLEGFLSEPLGAMVEGLARQWQRQRIFYHSQPTRRGRVVVSDEELAFHPDSRVPAVLSAFAREEGQARLV